MYLSSKLNYEFLSLVLLSFSKKNQKVVRKITIFLCLWIFVLCFKKLLFVRPLYIRLLSSIYSDGNDYVTSFMSSVRILSSSVSHGNVRNPAATTHLQLETAHRHRYHSKLQHLSFGFALPFMHILWWQHFLFKMDWGNLQIQIMCSKV